MDKECKACKEVKDIGLFYRMTKSSDGLFPKCKVCVDNRVPIVKDLLPVTDYKSCSRCKQVKLKSLFCKMKTSPDGYQYKCKDCEKEIAEIRKNTVILSPIAFKTCSKCGVCRSSDLFATNSYSLDGLRPDCSICKNEARIGTKEHEAELCRAYYQKNKKRINEYRRAVNAERRLNEPLYKARLSIRASVKTTFRQHALKKVVRKGKTLEIICCDFDYFINHMTIQFLDWMSWENQGNCEDDSANCKWHLEHIIPISYAKDEKMLYLLNHWSNFQPMCGKLNRGKSNKVYPCTNLELGITFWEDHYEYVSKPKPNPHPF